MVRSDHTAQQPRHLPEHTSSVLLEVQAPALAKMKLPSSERKFRTAETCCPQEGEL